MLQVEFLVLNNIFAEEGICFNLHLNEESPPGKLRKHKQIQGSSQLAHMILAHSYDVINVSQAFSFFLFFFLFTCCCKGKG